MADICLSPYKRKLIENWAREVSKFYKDGTICRVVLNTIAEPDDNEICIRPQETQSSEQTVKFTSLEKPKSSKNVDFRLSSSLNTQTLPAVSLNYIHGNKSRTELTQLNVFNLRSDVYDKQPLRDNHVDKHDDEDRPTMIIVDPQMITPSGNMFGDKIKRRDSNNIADNPPPGVGQSPRVPVRQYRESSFSNKKQCGGDIFAKCKVHSTDKNSFVVSRSNFRGSVNWRNHSFLDLPLRFRNDPQKATRSKPKTPKEMQTGALQKTEFGTPTPIRRQDNNNNNSQKLISTAVWAW